MSESEVGTGDVARDPASHVEFVRFRVGGETYALETGRVKQLVRKPSVTRVPRAPAAVAGATDVDGDVTAVIDGRALLGVQDPTDDGSTPVLLVFAGIESDQTSGLLVDAVERTETYPVERIAPPTDIDDGVVGADWFKAVLDGASGGADSTGVFDPDRLIEAAGEP